MSLLRRFRVAARPVLPSADHHDENAPAVERLGAVLEAYALMSHARRSGELATLLHSTAHVAQARAHLAHFIEQLLREAAVSGGVRRDVPPAELASYCLSALGGASGLPTRAAVSRLVAVTLAGLRSAAAS